MNLKQRLNLLSTNVRIFIVYSALTIIILFIAIAISYQYNRGLLTSEIRKSSNSLMDIYNTAINDQYIEAIDRIIAKEFISSTGSVRLMSFYKDAPTLSYSEYYNEINSIMLSNDFITSVFIYNMANDVAISTEKGLTIGLLGDENKTADAREISLVNYAALTDMKSQWISPTINDLLAASYTSNTLSRVIPIPLLGKNKKGVMIVEMKADSVFQTESLEEEEAFHLYILNTKGEIFAKNSNLTDDSEVVFPMEQLIHSDSGLYICKENEKEIVYKAKKLNSEDLYLVSRNESASLYKSSRVLLRITITVLIFFSLLSLFIIRLVSNAVSKHWLNLYKNMQIKLMEGGQKSNDSLVIPGGDAMNRLISQTKDAIIYKLMTDLIFGCISAEDEFFTSASTIGKEFNGKKYWLILCEIDKTMINRLSLVEREMLAIDIKNIFEDLYGSYQLSIYLDMNHIVSLVNIDNKKTNEESAAIFKHISSRIEGSFNLIISNPYEDILHSSVCYQTLLDNKNFRFLYGYSHIFFFDEVERWKQNAISLHDSQLDSIINGLQTGRDEAIADIRKVVQDMLEAHCSCVSMYDALFSILQTICRFIYGRQVTGKGMEGSMLKQFQDLETVEDYITWCDELISYYFEKITERNLCINGEYMLRISSYIMEHIEEDVSLGKLSSIFHISTGHLSRSFKDILGVAYSDFVLDAKLERGAQMLIEGNEPIKNIISFLGYETPSYFTKIFKNKYGVTPSQYRKEQTKTI
jgi:AraC-like DNA-binding protein